MDKSVPGALLIDLARPHCPKGRRGRPPYPLKTILRRRCPQLFLDLGDRAAQCILYDMPTARRFAGLSYGRPTPAETTIPDFRRLPERHVLGEAMFKTMSGCLESHGFRLSAGMIVDAMIVGAPSSTKNKDRARDPEMHSTKKGRQRHLGMTLRIGADEETGLTHSLDTMPANRSDVGMAGALLHGGEERVSGDAGYQGAGNRPENEGRQIDWKIAIRRGKRKMPGKDGPEEDEVRRKASVCARIEHPFRWLKRCFKCSKVRNRGLYKNRQRMAVLLGVTNLIMAGRHAAA